MSTLLLRNVLILAMIIVHATTSAGADATKPILDQRHVGSQACGPCSVINALAWGDESLRKRLAALPGDQLADKARTLIKDYGGKPSAAYKGQPRYSANEGMTWVDMPPFFNEVLAGDKAVVGKYLDRGAKEELPAHLRRVHAHLKRSVKAGVPVVTSLRSFAAQYNEQEGQFLWEGLLGHWVTIVRVDDTLGANAKGFSFSYVDPGTGKLEQGYIWYDEARNFTAVKGDTRKWQWVSDRPFLLVTAPSLRLLTQKQPWYVRTTITLNYVVTAK